MNERKKFLSSSLEMYPSSLASASCKYDWMQSSSAYSSPYSSSPIPSQPYAYSSSVFYAPSWTSAQAVSQALTSMLACSVVASSARTRERMQKKRKITDINLKPQNITYSKFMVGGNKHNVELTPEARQIIEYIRTIDPIVANAPFVSLDLQIVAGSMYTFHFNVNGKDQAVKAWSKPWQHFLQVTTTTGHKIVRQE